MKKIYNLIIVCFIAILSVCTVSTVESDIQVENLIKDQKFFQLREFLSKNENRVSKKNYLLAKSFLDNTFNKNEESNAAIESLINRYENNLPDTLMVELLWLKADNYLKLYNYAEAYKSNKMIMENYQHAIDSSELDETNNMSKIYKALYAVKPQKVMVEKEQQIPIIRDIVGLMNVEVTLSDSSYNFIFDTGAGMSVVTRSFAERNKFKIYDVDIDVKAATGKVIKSSMATIDSFRLGEINIYNAVFLVMEDELMQFPQIKYYPLGIIGFPIIEDFEEITITKTDTLVIPKSPQKSDLNNMRLNSLVPHVNLYNGKDTLEYAFDTGAKSSHLTISYFNLYKDELMKDGVIDTITTASAGGAKKETALVNNTISLFIGEEQAVLTDINIHNSQNHTFEDVYGNLGQDFIRQFDRMTLNFESMYLRFE